MKIVADTSAFVAVAFGEPERARLMELTTGHELVAPEILPFEIGNALIAMLKKGAISADELLQAWDTVNEIAVELRAVDVRAALSLASRLNVYAYDAYFLELAQRSGSPLLTLDNQMKRHAKKLGISVLE